LIFLKSPRITYEPTVLPPHPWHGVLPLTKQTLS
jgi:hypothetical protein